MEILLYQDVVRFYAYENFITLINLFSLLCNCTLAFFQYTFLKLISLILLFEVNYIATGSASVYSKHQHIYGFQIEDEIGAHCILVATRIAWIRQLGELQKWAKVYLSISMID